MYLWTPFILVFKIEKENTNLYRHEGAAVFTLYVKKLNLYDSDRLEWFNHFLLVATWQPLLSGIDRLKWRRLEINQKLWKETLYNDITTEQQKTSHSSVFLGIHFCSCWYFKTLGKSMNEVCIERLLFQKWRRTKFNRILKCIVF